MATQISATIQNENVGISRGKGIEGVKADPLKPERKERKDRKALADLSKPAKPTVSAALKSSTLKGKPSLRGSETAKKAPKSCILIDEEINKERSSLRTSETTKKAPKSNILTDEETKKCHEWAKEGIEVVHFTGNDLQRHEKDIIEKCVKKKVDMVMSSMSKWNQVVYDYVTPVKKLTDDIGSIKSLEPEPEVLLPMASLLPISGFDEGEFSPLGEEPEILWPFDDSRFELKLKEDMKSSCSFDDVSSINVDELKLNEEMKASLLF